MRYVSSVLSALILTGLFLSGYALGGIPQPSPAVLTISDGTTYNFGNVITGASAEHTFTVTNIGEAAAKLMVALNPASPFAFKGGSYPGTGGNCGKTLNGGGKTCRLVITFTPAGTGVASSSFGIEYFDRFNTQTVTRAVTGTGVVPATLTFQEGTQYDFGNTSNGTTKVRTLTLTNSGGTTATQLSASRLGGRFSFQGGYPGTGGTCGTSLNAGASCTMSITYSPTKTVNDSITLTVDYFNGGMQTYVSIVLLGKGTGGASSLVSISPDHGPTAGGTTVTLTGSGFSSPFTVTIGGTPCTGCVLVSSTQITCVTPAKTAGTYNVVLAASSTSTLTNGFIYDPSPSITSVDPAQGANKGGTVISITGTKFQSGITVSVGGSNCTNVVYINDNSIQCTTPSHSTQTVSVVVTNPDGQSGSLNNAFSFMPSWTWTSGSSFADQLTGANPGGRDSAASWTDSSNRFWLFGGWGIDTVGGVGLLNDLWRFDGANWSKIAGGTTVGQQGIYGTQGLSDANNRPGARMNGMTWRDSQNNLWLYGGFGLDANRAMGNLNDLWKFDGTNWVWVMGSTLRNQRGVYGTLGVPHASNTPGARVSGAHWVDSSNNLWLFGGFGIDSAGLSGELNDVWVFDGTNWTWMAGSNLRNPSGSYGSMGVASASNMPSGRDSASGWMDSSGNFFMFGGWGKDSANTMGYLSDLWKFDGTNWTWMSGSSLKNQVSNYGTKNIAAASNAPGARLSGISWMDSSNNIWLFGGYGLDSSGFEGGMNDLWKFDGINWTWVSGSQGSDVPGVYATQGTADLNTTPGTRQFSSGWIDNSNRLFLFGGFGLDKVGTEGELNDLWIYER